jgi:phage FluMu protein Com
MPQSHLSGTIRLACPACESVNEITALNLSWGEAIKCSHCQAPLGAWDVLMAAAEQDTPSVLAEAQASA